MKYSPCQNAFRISLSTFFLVIFLAPLFAQNQCLSNAEIEKLARTTENLSQNSLDKKLQKEVLKMKYDIIGSFSITSRNNDYRNRLIRGVFDLDTQIEQFTKTLDKKELKTQTKLCQILRENGWLGKSRIGDDGASALFYLLKNTTSFEFQMELLPIINNAVKQNEMPKTEDYASFVDRLRIRNGLKQIFGTQISERDGFLELLPIVSDEKVDIWRKDYGMPPLTLYFKYVETKYRMPLIKLNPRNVPKLQNAKANTSSLNASNQIFNLPELEDTIRIETSLVNLNLRILSSDFKTNVGAMEAKDFKVSEDGEDQKIEFFSRTGIAFDLVLLLDLSGSTVPKQNIIKKSAKRFIEAARPDDRIALITFTHKTTILSELSNDRESLLKKADKIGDNGGSFVWDALLFTFDNLFKDSPRERRKAVVIMTDGVDNALSFAPNIGSKSSFAELVENVRKNDVMLIPIYIDLEEKAPCTVGTGIICNLYKLQYQQAQATLSFLAEESGGQMYRAQNYNDLSGIYETVLNDLGTIYNIGYLPTKAKGDGSWRSINVQIPNQPQLIVRTKKGYYAK